MNAFPYLHQINCSPGGVPKLPVPQAWVSMEGVDGDRQRNRMVHGGPDRALCLYSWEVLQALQQEGHMVFAGAAGENLTLAGLDWKQMSLGDQLRIGENVHIELTSYCEPCRQNARWFIGKNYLRISHQHYPGWSRFYARVLLEGHVRQGDRVWVQAASGQRLQ